MGHYNGRLPCRSRDDLEGAWQMSGWIAPTQIAPLFSGATGNIQLPEAFKQVLYYS